jgi:hypothetical protein
MVKPLSKTLRVNLRHGKAKPKLSAVNETLG